MPNDVTPCDWPTQVIGSRNPRNAVKALVGGFESQRTFPEVVAHLKKTYGDNIIVRELGPGHKRKPSDRIPGLAGSWYLSRDTQKRLAQKRG
jgi:hypothetical protein